MPYEVKNYAAEGFGNGVVSADRRNQAQLEDYARTRNDFFTLLGNRMDAVAKAPTQERVNMINQIADLGITAATPRMNVDAYGNKSFPSNGQNERTVSNVPSAINTVSNIAPTLPSIQDYNNAKSQSALDPNKVVPYTVNGVTYNVPAGQIEQRFGTVFANEQYRDNALKLQEKLFAIPKLTQTVQQYEDLIRSGQPYSQKDYDDARKALSDAYNYANFYKQQSVYIPNTLISTGGLYGKQNRSGK